MADDSGPKDKSLEALDLVINMLKDHEQNLDKCIGHLSVVLEQIGDTETLNVRLDTIDEKINRLQEDVKTLSGYLLGNRM